jgi:hypothetical protein
MYYLQIRQELGLADHVWQDKKILISQSVDKLGDQFLPAMRTGWLSYLRRAYPEHDADGAGPAVGEDMLVLPDCAAVGCYKQRSPVMDDAIGLISAMNSNPNCKILICIYFAIMTIIRKIIEIIVI